MGGGSVLPFSFGHFTCGPTRFSCLLYITNYCCPQSLVCSTKFNHFLNGKVSFLAVIKVHLFGFRVIVVALNFACPALVMKFIRCCCQRLPKNVNKQPSFERLFSGWKQLLTIWYYYKSVNIFFKSPLYKALADTWIGKRIRHANRQYHRHLKVAVGYCSFAYKVNQV